MLLEFQKHAEEPRVTVYICPLGFSFWLISFFFSISCLQSSGTKLQSDSLVICSNFTTKESLVLESKEDN